MPPDLEDDQAEEGDVHEIIGECHRASVCHRGPGGVSPRVDPRVDSGSTLTDKSRAAGQNCERSGISSESSRLGIAAGAGSSFSIVNPDLDELTHPARSGLDGRPHARGGQRL